MAQEDERNSSSGSKAALKKKKIPQRGLGVAQLEKIRLEELHKNEGGVPPAPLFLSQPQRPSPSHELGSGLRSNVAPPRATASSNAYTYQSQLLHAIVNGSSSSIHQHQQLQNYSSKMNAATSNSISSGLNLQIEPPSNQSYNHLPSLHHDKPAIKRTYPFSLDQPRSPAKIARIRPLLTGFEENSSNENASAFNFQPGNSSLREWSIGASSHQLDRRAGVLGSNMLNGHKDQSNWKPAGLAELNLRNCNKENEPLDTSLTLGLPTPTLPTMPNKAKHPLEFPAPQYQERASINVPSQQEIFMGDPLFRGGESVQQQRVYDFLLPKPPQNNQSAAGSSGERRGISEPLDLDLKL